ncbi:MAG TPA: phosphoribosylpyrophosphate synthetase [Flavisolibacter sp.]|jgi:hypothetical protein|nr:phosphoribosylpyrophosphate synthetase [Flavisolibacter sp.]
MKNYDTVTEALADLKRRGFIYDFNLKQRQFHCATLNKSYNPLQLHVKETYRFEGATDPADEAVVYAIAADDGAGGVFVNGYGTYADTEAEAIIQSLRNREPSQEIPVDKML